MLHPSGDQSCRFEISERSGQHALGDAAQTPTQLPVPAWLLAQRGQNGHGPLAHINRGDRLRSWWGWNVHISLPVVSFLFSRRLSMQIAFRVVELADVTGFPCFAPLGTHVYLIDITER